MKEAKTRARWWVLVTALLLLAVAPLSVAAEAPSDLAGRAASWENAYNAGDDAGVAALYTEDAVRLPPDATPIEGRAAIQASLTSTRTTMGVARIEIAVLETRASGDFSWGRGTFRLLDAEGGEIDHGSWINVSRKIGATWLIHRDIWNSDVVEE